MSNRPQFMLHVTGMGREPVVLGPYTGTIKKLFGKVHAKPPKLGLLTDLTLAGAKWKWVRV